MQPVSICTPLLTATIISRRFQDATHKQQRKNARRPAISVQVRTYVRTMSRQNTYLPYLSCDVLDLPPLKLTLTFLLFLVDGMWGEWGNWGICSESCGLGVQSRIRSCDSPVPSRGGADCESGAESTEQPCQNMECPLSSIERQDLCGTIGKTMVKKAVENWKFVR